MGKLKNLLIEKQEMGLEIDEPYPWDMGAPLCRCCDSSKQNVITKDDKTKIVPCSYCDKPMQIRDKNV